MEKNLEKYVSIYKDFLSTEICDTTIDQLKSVEWKTNVFYNPSTDKKELPDNGLENDYSFDDISNNKVIMDKLWHVINDYISSLKMKWFYGWTGYTNLRYNKYSKNKKMAEHFDQINSIFDGETKGIPTLSIIGTLNDDYKGGELVMFKDKTYKLNKGDVMMFPSTFLYPHRVEPVIEGTRYSYVSWVY